MGDTAISIQGLGKRYKLGTLTQAYETLGDVASRLFRAAIGNGNGERREDQHIWALKDVDIEVKQGEVLGIIGRNGAGKSTLLKILSRITSPTTGRVEIKGRIGTLLEVGTGFHPELTGRENIFLNGAILGMTRAEIKRKFEEIVDFSGVEKFIDTPVKRYSSGMYVRLAFAVAAHLEPEILLVDEVLAVGDSQFQKRCLGKIGEVAQGGRTVLFVSHNMPAVTRICPRCIMFDQGKVIQDGPSPEVMKTYLGSGQGSTSIRKWADVDDRPGNEVTTLKEVRVVTENGKISESIDIRYPVGISMDFDVHQSGLKLVPNFHFYNEEGILIFVAGDRDVNWTDRTRDRGAYTCTVWIPGNLLSEGWVLVSVAVTQMEPTVVHFFEREALAFNVVDSMEGDTVRGSYVGAIPGVVRPKLRWKTDFSPEESQSEPNGNGMDKL